MYSYSVIQWLFFFYFYCFFGWCFESTYVSVKSHRLVNRGFLRGPFLPLYGCGAIMMLVVSAPFQDNLVLVYIAGCLGATVLEYVTGVVMEALFKVRYWDYSQNKFNFHGYICLGSSLAWGLLTILMTEFLHKPVERLVLSIPTGMLTVVTLILTAGICADFALSFKAALDLRDILVKMDKAKEELLRIQKRLDVIIAVTGEELTNRRDDLTQSFLQKKDDWSRSVGTRVEDVKTNIEEKMEGLRELGASRQGAIQDDRKQELIQLREKYIRAVDEQEHLSGLKDFFQRGLIRSNPGMSSIRFREALEELQRRMNEKRKK